MPISVVCQNIINYDSAKGRYRTCDEEMMVEDEMAGSTILCPVCNNVVEIPVKSAEALVQVTDRDEELFGDDALFGDGELKLADEFSQDDDELQLYGEELQTIGDDSEEDSQDSFFDVFEESKSSPKKSSNPVVAKQAKTGEAPNVAPATVDYKKFKNTDICHNCGEQLKPEDTMCYVCHKPRKLGYRPTKELAEAKYKYTGFQLWFKERLNPEKGSMMLIILAGGLVYLSVLVLVAAVSFFSAGPIGLFILIPFLLLPLFIGLATYRWRQLVADPRLQLTGFFKSMWNFLLKFNRKRNWKRMFDNDSNRKVLDLRRERIVNVDLREREDIAESHVLDLEGQLIDDEGLSYLHGRNNILFLVVKRTRVTPEGVFQLQQTIPRAWIWH